MGEKNITGRTVKPLMIALAIVLLFVGFSSYAGPAHPLNPTGVGDPRGIADPR